MRSTTMFPTFWQRRVYRQSTAARYLARKHARPPLFRPQLEALENRFLLASGVTALSPYPDGHQIDLFTIDHYTSDVWTISWSDSTGTWGRPYIVPGLHG